MADGRPGDLHEYESTRTLGWFRREMDKRGLLEPHVRDILLKNVTDLRNSVAHRHAIFVTVPSPIEGQAIGVYKGGHVFIHREALDELSRDVDAPLASRGMWNWIATMAPDLAEDARRGGQARRKCVPRPSA